MVDLSRLMKRWRDDRFYWRKGQTRVTAKAAKFDLVDFMLMNGVWRVQRGGDFADLKPDYAGGGSGKFDERRKKVVLRQW